MPFKETNEEYGLDRRSQFRVGISNKDTPDVIEKEITLPWVSDPVVSWAFFDCTISVTLDSGIVVHNKLPQINNLPDTIASSFLEDDGYNRVKDKGVNLKSTDQYEDIMQRMGHSRYWFRLHGQALRYGYRIPIPAIKTVGGVNVIPHDNNPQWGFNRIAPGSNIGGVPLWHAQWSLWYTTLVPPTIDKIPEVDPTAHLESLTPPNEIQSPYSAPDSESRTSEPILPTPIRGV